MAISGILAFFLILPLGAISNSLRSFFVGLLGWFSIAALAGAFMVGLMMFLRKRITLHPKYIAGIAIISFSALLILQLITSFGLTNAYGERAISDSFSSYMSGVWGGNTMGGVLFGVFAYAMAASMGLPISFVILSVVIAFSSLLFVDVNKLKAYLGKRSKEKQAQGFFNSSMPRDNAQPIASQNKSGLYVANIVPLSNEQVQPQRKKGDTSWPKPQTVTSFGVSKKGLFDREEDANIDHSDPQKAIHNALYNYNNNGSANYSTSSGFGRKSNNDDSEYIGNGKSAAFNILYKDQIAPLKKAQESVTDGKSMLITPQSILGGPTSSYGGSSSSYGGSSSSVSEPSPSHIINRPPKFIHGQPTGLKDVVVPVDKDPVEMYDFGEIINGDAFSTKPEIENSYKSESDESKPRSKRNISITDEEFGGVVMPGFMVAKSATGIDSGSSNAIQSTISAYAVETPQSTIDQIPIVNGDSWKTAPAPKATPSSIVASQTAPPVAPQVPEIKQAPIFVAGTTSAEPVRVIDTTPERPIVEERSVFVEPKEEPKKEVKSAEDNLFDLINEDKLSRGGDDIIGSTDYVEKEELLFTDEEEIIDKTEYDAPVVSMDFDRTGEYNIIQPEDEQPKRVIKPFRTKTHINQISVEKVLKDNATEAIQAASAPRPRRSKGRYKIPPIELLIPQGYGQKRTDDEKKIIEQKLEEALSEFDVPVKVFNSVEGPSVTRFELEIIKQQDRKSFSVRDIEKYAEDIAYSMASNGAIRIEAPIPGRKAVGIEIPNQDRASVGLREIIESSNFAKAPSPLTLALGEDIGGEKIVCDLAKMPHLLVAGSTGSGKSACLNSIIASIIYKASPDDVRLILVDPKRVEFSVYKGLPHLMLDTVITEAEQAINAFSWAIVEMERRYKLLERYEVKNIGEFNSLSAVRGGEEEKLPYIVMIVDELADLMLTSKREVEDKIRSITQKARAAGIHLIIATQRPSVDVITGTIKANLPSRIAFAVTSNSDSRTILDQIGAETLLGRGDMLYAPIDAHEPKRVQGAFITNEEVTAIVNYVKENNESYYDENIKDAIFVVKNESVAEIASSEESEFDALLPDVTRRIIESGQASSSMVMRRFSVGYARAARIIDQLEQRNLIGPPDGSRPREVFITKDMFEDAFGEEF